MGEEVPDGAVLVVGNVLSPGGRRSHALGSTGNVGRSATYPKAAKQRAEDGTPELGGPPAPLALLRLPDRAKPSPPSLAAAHERNRSARRHTDRGKLHHRRPLAGAPGA